MTTIIYSNGVLVADGQVTAGSGKVMARNFQKIFTPQNCFFQNDTVLAYGLAGDATSRLILERLMQADDGLLAGDQLESDDDFEAIIVCESGVYYVEKYSASPHIKALEIHPEHFWAIGSGGQVATWLLNKGYSLEDAMTQAVDDDIYSGGELTAWER